MRLFSLKNKIILITGASGLLGQEHAEAICKAKGVPVLLDLNQNDLDNQVRYLKKKYNILTKGYAVDITDESQVKRNCKKIILEFSKIDGLINNAANNPKFKNIDKKGFSRLERFEIESWDKDLSVSLTGSFLCSKHYGFQISKNPKGGSIINVSSDLGIIAPNQNLYKKEKLKEDEQPVKPVSYSVVKHGVIGLTKYISTYWAANNVRSNAICLGGVFNNQSKDFLDRVSNLIPLGRMAKKDEYHGLIIYLLSDSSSYINGSIISADGGRTVW